MCWVFFLQCLTSFIYLFLQQKKHLVTASYVDNSMSAYHEMAKDAGVTILCEMGLDPGIGNKCVTCINRN